jgi:hypothetical protein
MTELYDWSSFYEALRKHGPNLLIGIDDEMREMIEVAGSSTDMFWSDGLQERLAEGAANDNLRTGVLSAIELWREYVIETLDADFAIELDRNSVSIDVSNPLVDELVVAAAPD